MAGRPPSLPAHCCRLLSGSLGSLPHGLLHSDAWMSSWRAQLVSPTWNSWCMEEEKQLDGWGLGVGGGHGRRMGDQGETHNAFYGQVLEDIHHHFCPGVLVRKESSSAVCSEAGSISKVYLLKKGVPKNSWAYNKITISEQLRVLPGLVLIPTLWFLSPASTSRLFSSLKSVLEGLYFTLSNSPFDLLFQFDYDNY